MKSMLSIKNGRKFISALKKAAKDPNAGMMFLDNLKYDVEHLIEKGRFNGALTCAFLWKDSNEGRKFWLEVDRNLQDLKGAEDEKVR